MSREELACDLYEKYREVKLRESIKERKMKNMPDFYRLTEDKRERWRQMADFTEKLLEEYPCDRCGR